MEKVNIIDVRAFNDRDSVTLYPIYQYDVGQILRFEDVFEDGTFVQFKYQNTTMDKPIVNNQVQIPSELLKDNAEIVAWVQIIDSESETTIKEIKIPIRIKNQGAGVTTPDDEQTFKEWIEQTMNDTKAIAQSVRNDANAGKFDGDDYVITDADKKEIAEMVDLSDANIEKINEMIDTSIGEYNESKKVPVKTREYIDITGLVALAPYASSYPIGDEGDVTIESIQESNSSGSLVILSLDSDGNEVSRTTLYSNQLKTLPIELHPGNEYFALTYMNSSGTANVQVSTISIDKIELPERIEELETEIDANKEDYQGVDLTVKFADEISAYQNAFAWVKARCKDNNFEGINVGDWIPLTLSSGGTLQMQVAGIDTYYSSRIQAGGAYSGNPNKYHMIDFIAKTCAPDGVQWNTTATNNGTSDEQYPYRASNLYKYLNETLYNRIPEDVRNLIATKYLPLSKRYNSSGSLTYNSGLDNIPVGKIWTLCLDEIALGLFPAQNKTTGVHYPLMKSIDNRLKAQSPTSSTTASYIWLMDAYVGNSNSVHWVDKYSGTCNGQYNATFTARTYVGFRIQGD